MSLLSNIGAIAKTLVTPKAGGSPVGNILRNITGTTNPLDTAKSLGKMTGELLGGSSGLPSVRDILGGAAKGAGNTVLQSEAGQQVQKDVAISYLKDNAYKFAAWIFGGILLIVSGIMIFKGRKTRR